MSENELSDFKEIVHNGEPIDWDYWASLQKITPHKAAKLAFCIDPHRWNGNQYSGGDVKKGTAIPKDLTKKILDFEVWLEGIKQEWTLQEIARALGENAPVGMIEVLTKSIIVHDIQPLNELTDEERKAYYSQRFCWNWVEAIYILQGFKPVFQISTEQVRSHFPVEFHYFSEALRNGGIGKRTEIAGDVTYEDTIENWQKFWQKYNNAPLGDIEPIKTDSNENTTTEQPKKTSIYELRDNDCKVWLESEKPPIHKMTMLQIQECLKARDVTRDGRKLWQSGFNDWWKKQNLITLERGRKPRRQYK